MSTFTNRERSHMIWGGGIVALTALVVIAISQALLKTEIFGPEFIRTARLYAAVTGMLAALWASLAAFQTATD